ncbi:hypothetical protein B0A49_00214 [Cryomyces minteri]|uniref:GYF domain-containing protein n=1 Tax=Cryomyces minteri TaxID=331657 RepID=A0A4U0XU73_9PEZI|nr:hypothetical protein B0A49_00214 [Cryomyces minteri]
MSTAARPKRAAETFARTHHSLSTSDEPSAKKAKFDVRNPSTLAPDAPEEDAILDLDEIGKSGQTKRNAVNIDGYDSDSSNENFDARAEARSRLSASNGNGWDEPVGRKGKEPVKSKDEDENDMFADLEDRVDGGGDEDEDLAREGKKRKKDVRFLDETEIEGQVASSKSGGHVSANLLLPEGQDGRSAARMTDDVESSSDSGGEEERDRIDLEDVVDEELGAGGKKHHAPKLDAFNMKQEGEEGRFDASGNFVRKAADPDAVHDAWLEGLSKRDMKRAREAQALRDEERRRKENADDALLTSELLATLMARLQRGETVLEALQRLGGKKTEKKRKPKWQKNKRKAGTGAGAGAADDMDLDTQPSPAPDPAETRRVEAVEAITGAADALFSRGDADIYESEREALQRRFRRETGEDWVERASTPSGQAGEAGRAEATWEYRWSDARDGGERHGPFDGRTMRAWRDAGYFGDGVEFRRGGDEGWSRLAEFG